MSELLLGRHAVLEALRAGRRHFYRLWLEGDADATPKGSLAEIVGMAERRKLPLRHIEGGLFDRMRRAQLNPQGVALETGPYPYTDLERTARHQGWQAGRAVPAAGSSGGSAQSGNAFSQLRGVWR